MNENRKRLKAKVPRLVVMREFACGGGGRSNKHGFFLRQSEQKACRKMVV